MCVVFSADQVQYIACSNVHKLIYYVGTNFIHCHLYDVQEVSTTFSLFMTREEKNLNVPSWQRTCFELKRATGSAFV